MLKVAIMGVYCWIGIKTCKIINSVIKVYNILSKEERETNIPQRCIRACWKTSKFFIDSTLLRTEQFFRKTVQKHNKHYIVQFWIEGKIYKLYVNPERGPSHISLNSEKYTFEQYEEIQSYIRASKSIMKPTCDLIEGIDNDTKQFLDDLTF